LLPLPLDKLGVTEARYSLLFRGQSAMSEKRA
jgi:hypothetical protein